MLRRSSRLPRGSPWEEPASGGTQPPPPTMPHPRARENCRLQANRPKASTPNRSEHQNAPPCHGADLHHGGEKNVQPSQQQDDPALGSQGRQHPKGGGNTFSAPKMVEQAHSVTQHRRRYHSREKQRPHIRAAFRHENRHKAFEQIQQQAAVPTAGPQRRKAFTAPGLWSPLSWVRFRPARRRPSTG